MGEAGETASTTEGAAPCARQLRKLMRRPGLLAVVVVLGLISAGTIIEIGLAMRGERGIRPCAWRRTRRSTRRGRLRESKEER